ncbi:hypothetical protein [Pseudomonas putida]|uniref:hypothetical protein n=1 Tax=Pseudomonas putida TaxID=303 RepID=UPI0018D7EA38|nr:hypothetical protein [Pseudomonas putida]MBH3412557.1 hypothetical protein [Pseudomonas putida]
MSLKVGDTLRFKTRRVTSEGLDVNSSAKSGRIQKIIPYEKGCAYIVLRKGKRELVLDSQVIP